MSATIHEFPGSHPDPEPTPPSAGAPCGLCSNGSNSYAIHDSRGRFSHWTDERCTYCGGSGFRLEPNEPGADVPGDVECLDCAGSGLASMNVEDGFFFRTDETDPNLQLEAAQAEDHGWPVVWIDPPAVAVDWNDEVRQAVRDVEIVNRQMGKLFASCAGRARDRNARNGRPTPAQLAPLQEERSIRIEWLAHCHWQRDGGQIEEVAA